MIHRATISETITPHSKDQDAVLRQSWLLFALAVVALNAWAERKPEPLKLPQQTPLTLHQLDANNVIMAHLPDGTTVYNIFGIAMQALQGRSAFTHYLDRSNLPQQHGLLPRTASGTGLADPYQTVAYRWLDQHAQPIGADGLIWYYQFDNVYNDIAVKAPWGSAFGQAHVIQAYLHAYQVTGSATYRDSAIRASKPFAMQLAEGGFQSRLPDGSIFFEEVPHQPATHILNGHMISTLTLLQTGKALDEPWISQLGLAGIKTLRQHLHQYDVGYWSKYDLNPKKGEIIFRLAPRQALPESVLLMDRASLITTAAAATTDLDVGAQDDHQGAWRISGLEWGARQQIDGRTVRSVFHGPSRHCQPVPGGSLQNTYLIFQLPSLTFAELSLLPTYLLRLDYYDDAPGAVDIEIQDISHGNFMGFRTLPQGTIYTTGSQTWRSAYISVGSRELGWYMGPDYQAYHKKLLDDLYQFTGEPFLAAYARRWHGYLRTHTETNVEARLTVQEDCPHATADREK